MGSGAGVAPNLKRAAVTIGVNNTGGMTPLRAAASGAEDIARWLEGEGYDVTCLTDEDRAVTARMVKDAIRAYVATGTLDRIVVYFAGHGYLNGTSEIWLLSGAPTDPEEAVDLNFSAELARSCGVRSVVFISDACRSNPPTLTGARVQGSSVFPNFQGDAVDVEVDRFFAARPGDPALELEIGEARATYAGLFTEILRRMHRDPDPGITRSLRVGDEDLVVVPSRRLKELLPDCVNEAAQERSIRLKQVPQLRLECGEDGFVARAMFTRMASDSVGRARKPAGGSIRYKRADGAAPRNPLRSRGAMKGGKGGRGNVDLTGHDAGARAQVDLIRSADRTGRFETGTGVQITGIEVLHAVCPGFEVTREQGAAGGRRPAGGATRLRVGAAGSPYSPPAEAGTVLVQFGDGSGTVVATLPGYIASVLVEDGRVVNVSYVPSENAGHWNDYQVSRDEVEGLRASAAVAARGGLLAVDREDAREFGDRIRRLKRLDPTLGLYAAVSYADVGLRDQVASVRDFMRRDIGADLFDVALLAGPTGRSGARDAPPVVPFCPMLSQSWSFLRASGVRLHPVLVKASLDRRPALWTTFNPGAVASLRDAMERGKLR